MTENTPINEAQNTGACVDEITVKKPKKEKFRTPLAPRTSPKDFWYDALKNKKYLALCFAIPALVMLLMYVCFEVYPIGEGSVLVLDLNGQYVYFFEGLRDILYGEGSLLYSFSRALGGEFIGIFAYYLSSPFSLLVALFPKDAITEALLLMFLLKVGACGLTFGIYIEATRKRNRVATVIFSTMYALCGYAVVMQHNTMWIDNLILLPIIMLGIENIIKYGKYRMFIISLAMAIFSNFYIGYMTCIFVFLYFFYYYFASSPEERNPRGERIHFLKSSGRMALYSVITIAICSALLLCTYYSLTLGKTTFSNPNYRFEQKFDWLDMLTKVFVGSYDTVRPEGLPFLYSGVLTLMLLPLYFFAPHIKPREKTASGILILVFLASFNVSVFDLFWHGLQRPNWLNYRYSFILCFFVILLAYKGFEKLREIGYKRLIPVAAFLIVLLLIIQKEEYEHVDDFYTIWLNFGIIALYLGLLRAVTAEKKHIRRAGALILALFVSCEMFVAGLLNMDALGADVVYSTRTSYRTFIDGLRPSVNAVLKNDTSFYRMEKTAHRKTNDNFALGMNGLSNSTSTLNSETIKLLNNFGLSSKSHWSKYLGGTPVSDTLFGIKYVVTEKNGTELMELYDETKLGKGDYKVYKNPYAMSIATGVSPNLAELSTFSYHSAFDLMNATVTAMLGEKEPVNVFRVADTEPYISEENTRRSSVAAHTKYEPEEGYENGRITFYIHVDTTDVLYMFIPSEYPRECQLYVNGLKKGSYFGNETDRIVELGSFKDGETVTVTLETVEEAVYLLSNHDYFYFLDSKTFEEKIPELLESSFVIDEYNDDRFEGTINIKKGDTLVYTSIPYDEGWKIYADGERVELKKLLDGTIGFSLSKGEHTLEMKYRPDCLYLGVFISVIGGVSFAIVWFMTELLRKKKLCKGYSVYVIPDRGDIRFDDLPTPPDPDAFDDANTSDDSACEFSAIEESEEPAGGETQISAIDENIAEGDENL